MKPKSNRQPGNLSIAQRDLAELRFVQRDLAGPRGEGSSSQRNRSWWALNSDCILLTQQGLPAGGNRTSSLEGQSSVWPLWNLGGQALRQSVNHTVTNKEPCTYITWAYSCTCSVLLTYKYVTRHRLYVLGYTSFYLFPGGRTVITCRMGF